MSDRLAELAEGAALLLHGQDGFMQRLSELGSGYPSQGDYQPGNAALGGPTAATAIARLDGRYSDVALMERDTYERHIRRALTEVQAALRVYDRVVQRRLGVAKVEDPGCELCAKVPCGGTLCAKPKDGMYRCEAIDARHWCATRYTVDVETPAKRKGDLAGVRRVRLCSSCYEFQRPDRAARLPTHDEVLDHVEGRRRQWRLTPMRRHA